MIYRIIKHTLVLLLILYTTVFSAEITVESSLDRNKGYVGDQIKYDLIITADSLINVDSIYIPEEYGDFSLQSWDLSDRKYENGKRVDSYSGTITSFKTGNIYLPSLTVRYSDPQGTVDSINTDSIEVHIQSLLINDSLADIKALKGVRSLRASNWWFWLIIPALVLTAGIIFWLIKRRKTPEEIQHELEQKSPWEAARERLQKLKHSSLEPKPYYIELSEIIREYIQRRYGFSALDMTTYELKYEIKNCNLNDNLINIIHVLLDNSDLAKFAKFKPDIEWMREDFQRAWNVVEMTTPEEPLTVEANV